MYIHIGNNNIISAHELIGFFDYKIIKDNNYENIINKNEFEENKIKSVVITESEKKVKNYISNISTNTLSKRKI